MPTISAVPFTTLPAVRILVNWADTPGAANATVFRIDCATGEEVQLRPYVAYNADGYILLSCGQAVIWDTEIPFDRCVRYCTRAQTSLGVTIMTPAAPVVVDTFTRVVAAGMGSTDNGLPYTISGGIAANYSVNGTQGQQQLTNTNVSRHSWVNAGTVAFDATITLSPQVVALTQPILGGLIARLTNTTAYYSADAQMGPGGTVNLYLREGPVEGAHIDLVSVGTAIVQTAATFLTLRFQGIGNRLRAKIWESTTPEPTDWMVMATSSTYLTQTNIGFRSILITGNTNATPVNVVYDNFLVTDPCAPSTVAESCGDDLMVGSSGWSMLRDPVRPCNDLHVGICWTPDPECVPGHGVFFQRLEGEGYAGNSVELRPFNSPRPASASRERSDAASTLVLVTRTFADRDAMLEILRAGTPLLWQAPPEYGQPDRYIQIGDVNVARYNQDHRYQPRTFTLPFLTEDRPEGPSQGICGTRVKDLCDIYPTWSAMQAAGLSYQDLLLGFASPSGPPDPNRRRWIDVETGFANWLAVETAPNTWKTLRDGE